jgi:RND family efflux transporter MFP subunit
MNLDIKNIFKNAFTKSKATLIVVGLTALIIFYLNATKTETEIVNAPEKLWPIQAVQAEYKNTTPNLKVFGEITSARRSDLRVSVGGQVMEVGENFKEGGVVKTGELLLRVDNFEYQNAVTEGQAKFDIRKRDSDRAEKLYLKGSVSEQFKDNALLEKTQQEIILAEAKKDLRDTQLFAPYDGVINGVVASLGKQVSTFNDKVGEIIDIKNLEVRFSLSKAQYGRLLEDNQEVVGRPVSVNWTAGNKTFSFDANIARIGAEIKSNTGGVDVYASLLPNNTNISLIRPGAFVAIKVPDKTYNQVISLPDTAIYEDSYIFVIKNERLEKRSVSILGYDNINTLIVAKKPSVIENGDMIAVTQLREAGEGVKVNIL